MGTLIVSTDNPSHDMGMMDGYAGNNPQDLTNEIYMNGYREGLAKAREEDIKYDQVKYTHCYECGEDFISDEENASHTCKETQRYKLVKAYRAIYVSTGSVAFDDKHLIEKLSEMYDRYDHWLENHANATEKEFPRRQEMIDKMEMIMEALP